MKKLSELSGKELMLIMLAFVIVFTIIMIQNFNEMVGEQEKALLLKHKLLTTELNGRVKELHKENVSFLFTLDNDTNHYVIGNSINEKYTPSSLTEMVSEGSKITKKSGSDTILLNDTCVFVLLKTINYNFK
jgi:hypothetical protein